MHTRHVVLFVAVAVLLVMLGCGDSSSTPKISMIAFVHTTNNNNVTMTAPARAGDATFHSKHLASRPNSTSATYTINTMKIDGTGSQALYTSTDPIYGVDLSRDQKKIAYIAYDSVSDYEQIYILDVATKQSTKLTSDGIYKYEAIFAADGKNVIYRAYTGTYGAQLWSIPIAGGTAKAIPTSDAICLHEPHLSLDGTKIVFEFHDNANHSETVGYVNVDGTGFKIVEGTSGVSTPAFSSANSKIYYANWTTYYPQLSVMNADGTSVKALVEEGASIDPYPVGDKVLFGWDKTGSYVDLDIYLLNADGTNPKKLTSGGLNFMNWSGD